MILQVYAKLFQIVISGIGKEFLAGSNSKNIKYDP